MEKPGRPTQADIARVHAKIEADIARVGWHVTAVLDTPAFAYSIGLTETLGHAEFVMAGFSPELMHRLINDCARMVRSRRASGEPDAFVPGARVEEIVRGYPVLVRAVEEAAARAWAIGAKTRYGAGGFSLLQICLPDPNGLFPDEPGCDPRYVLMQAAPARSAS